MPSVLRYPLPKEFLRLWAAQVAALLGKRVTRVAMFWWLSQQPSAALGLTFALGIVLVPTVVLGPFLGVPVDRFSRQRMMLAAEVLQAVAIALLLAGSYGVEVLPHWVIFTFLFLSESVAVVMDASLNATMPLMLKEGALSRVQGVNQTIFHGLDLLAAPLGLFLFSQLGFDAVFTAHLILSFTALLLIRRLQIPSPSQPLAGRGTFLLRFAEGAKALRQYRKVLILLMLLSAANFLTAPVTSLRALLVSEHFGGGPTEFSQVEVVASAGVLLGGLVLAGWGQVGLRAITFLTALSGLGASILVAGLLAPDAFIVLLIALFTGGLSTPFLIASFLVTLQVTIPVSLQGRVLTLAGTVALLPAALGLPWVGVLAEGLGVIPVYRLTGSALLTVALVSLLHPWWRGSRAELEQVP